MARGVGGGGGGRGMSGGSGGRGMSGGRGGGSIGRNGGSAGRGGGMGGGRGGGMGGSRSGGMGGAPGPQRRRSSGGFGAGFGAGMMMGSRRRRRAPRGGMVMGGGCLSGFMFPLLIVIIVVIMIVSSVAVANMDSGSDTVAYEGEEITRTKLADNQCTESSEWIDDELGWLSSQSTVKKAMESFYSETGVQPYLIITDNIDGKGAGLTDDEVESYLEETYDSLYNDEGHMILLFIEYEPGEYYRYIFTGSAADGVIDASAKDYIANLVDSYYTDSSLTDDEYFAKIFTDAGKNLMQDYNESTRTRNIIIIIVVVGVILIIVLILAKRYSDSKAKEAERTKEILDTPIGNSSSDDELLHKYGDDSSGGSSGGSSGAGN